MKTKQPSISIYKAGLWIFLVNAVLIGFTLYAHALLWRVGNPYGNAIFENVEIWLLVLFKLIGGNLILAVILSEFNIHS